MLKEFELQKKHLEQKHQLLAAQDEGDNQSVRSRRSIVSHSARSTRTMNWVQQHKNASKENVAVGAPLDGAVGGTLSAVQATAPAGNDTQQRPQHVTPGESVLVRELKRREEESQRQIQMLRDQLNQLQLEIQQQKKGNQVTNAATSKGAVSKTRPNITAIAPPAHRLPSYIDWQISPVETGQPAPIMTFEQPRKHARSFQNADTVPDIPTFEQQRNVARMNQMNREVGQTVRQREQSSCIPQASSVERNPVIERQRPQPTLTIAHSGPSSSEPPADMAVAAANIGPTQEQLAARHQIDHMHHHSQSKLLFRIIPVTLYGQQGIINTFAFLDEGSSLSMIESSLADRLGVDGYSRPLCLKWTGNVTREENDSKRVAFEISGLGKTERYWISDVGTTKSLNLPMQTLPVKKLMQDFQHLRGIPIEEYHDAVPRLLIGVDNLKLSLLLKVREGKEGVPVAVKTRLGWCVYGGQRSDDSSLASYHICECNEDTGMDETVKAYFSMEDVGVRPTNDCMSEEDKRAHQILEETTIFVGDRYESGLLWRFDKFELPDSYPMAIKRLQCLQRRMEKDPVLKENIQRQIQEYLERGYAHRASAKELSTADPRRIWFLPLGAVVNPKKPSKVRLIWDASAKVDGISLNDMLLKGPDQLASLPGVIFRFRQHRVAVVGDIKQMFHQIFIKNSDRYAHCFLWSPKAQKKPDVFVMNVATFGSTSSPATAQFVKNVNAQRFSEEFPRAVEGIVYNHYVDDYLDSFPDEDEAKRVAGEVRDVHRKGGFEIRNWCSNSSAVLKHLGENQDKVVKNLNPDSGGLPDRVLGMLWNSEEDVIHFVTAMRENIKKIIQEDARPTKRQVLQCVMTLFDPLGLLAPYLIFGRVLIQDIWRAGTKWDEQVDDSIFQRWRDWVKILQDIDEVRIPRCYFRCANRLSLDRIQLHIFVDASPAAYSCACYFRIINAQGKAEVALVAAKAKVAPLKMMSVPRLELQACVLGVRMMKLVIDGHTFPIKARFLWTDSSTAHTWINGDPYKYRPFVAHRVSEILDTTTREEWRWLRSKMNSADEATKWGVGPHFNDQSIWLSYAFNYRSGIGNPVADFKATLSVHVFYFLCKLDRCLFGFYAY
ncbi:uncharacterized protein LOC134291044 [Aedes albopictus]|uniref:Reverse transcriptase domain-containing protein n=1 Tax=Aedes albopictus TaxID=7160 RepID=A0ABM1ZUZ5_AEDAL